MQQGNAVVLNEGERNQLLKPRLYNVLLQEKERKNKKIPATFLRTKWKLVTWFLFFLRNCPVILNALASSCGIKGIPESAAHIFFQAKIFILHKIGSARIIKLNWCAVPSGEFETKDGIESR